MACMPQCDQIIGCDHRLRRVGGVVTQRIANPCTPVRFRYSPPRLFNTLARFVRSPSQSARVSHERDCFCIVFSRKRFCFDLRNNLFLFRFFRQSLTACGKDFQTTLSGMPPNSQSAFSDCFGKTFWIRDAEPLQSQLFRSRQITQREVADQASCHQARGWSVDWMDTVERSPEQKHQTPIPKRNPPQPSSTTGFRVTPSFSPRR